MCPGAGAEGGVGRGGERIRGQGESPLALKANVEAAPIDLKLNSIHRSPSPLQALKANVEAAPSDLKLNSNYLTRFGQVGAECVGPISVCPCTSPSPLPPLS